jgi:dTDP-4-dehydrorhamnose 3,5-epimerase
MIKDIKIVELKTHYDDRGFFREIFRFNEQFKGIPVGQISNSLVKAGVIKGWHGHTVQFQWNYVVSGEIKVALYDNRKDSMTFNKMINFKVGNQKTPTAYFFPPGVLHAYKCIKDPMQIIYITSGSYDLSDEIRIDIGDIKKKPFE